jgi:hypothetical protein
MCKVWKVGERVIASTESYIGIHDKETKPRDIIGVIRGFDNAKVRGHFTNIYRVELQGAVRVGHAVYTTLYLTSKEMRTIPKGLRV